MSYAREVIRVARNYGHELTAAMDVDRLEEELDAYDAEVERLLAAHEEFKQLAERLHLIEEAARAVFLNPLDADAMLALGAALEEKP